MIVPEWLAKRDGSLKPGLQPHMVHVLLGGSPQYRIEVRPANGTFVAVVQESNNGKRLDDAKIAYATADSALAGGCEQLHRPRVVVRPLQSKPLSGAPLLFPLDQPSHPHLKLK